MRCNFSSLKINRAMIPSIDLEKSLFKTNILDNKILLWSVSMQAVASFALIYIPTIVRANFSSTKGSANKLTISPERQGLSPRQHRLGVGSRVWSDHRLLGLRRAVEASEKDQAEEERLQNRRRKRYGRRWAHRREERNA